MSGSDWRERNSQSDAPKPEDTGFEHGPGSAQALAAREDIPYGQRLRVLQKMLAEAGGGGQAAAQRREIRLALETLGADVVTDEDQPSEAPKKSGYSPSDPSE